MKKKKTVKKKVIKAEPNLAQTASSSDVEKACRAVVDRSRDEVLRGIASAMDDAAEAIKRVKIPKPPDYHWDGYKSFGDFAKDQKFSPEIEKFLDERKEEIRNGDCVEVADVNDLLDAQPEPSPEPLPESESLPSGYWQANHPYKLGESVLFPKEVPSVSRRSFFDDVADIGLRLFSTASLAVFAIRFYIERHQLRAIPKWEWVIGFYFLISVLVTAYKDIRGTK